MLSQNTYSRKSLSKYTNKILEHSHQTKMPLLKKLYFKQKVRNMKNPVLECLLHICWVTISNSCRVKINIFCTKSLTKTSLITKLHLIM